MTNELRFMGGEPGGIRTRDPQLRRLLLYPAELPVRKGCARRPIIKQSCTGLGWDCKVNYFF